MSIAYTYEIVSVNEAGRCMEIVYRADGHQTMHISTRLPLQGEDVENVVRQYEPVALWLDLAANVQAPAVGTSGSIAPPADPVTEPTVASDRISVTELE